MRKIPLSERLIIHEAPGLYSFAGNHQSGIELQGEASILKKGRLSLIMVDDDRRGSKASVTH